MKGRVQWPLFLNNLGGTSRNNTRNCHTIGLFGLCLGVFKVIIRLGKHYSTSTLQGRIQDFYVGGTLCISGVLLSE